MSKLFVLALSFLVAATACADQIVWQGALEAGDYRLVKVTPDSTPPPDPEPPIDPTECHDGYVNLTGWWGAWCGRSLTSFRSEGNEYGAMKTNTQAVRFFDEGRRIKDGWIEIDIYFATDRVPQDRGGLHIMSVASAHKGLGSPIVGSSYAGWLRPDFETKPISGQPQNAELKIGTYFSDRNGVVTVRNWSTGITLRPKVWIPIRLEWRRSGTTFTMSLNGRTQAVGISADCLDIFGMSAGNMDDLHLDGGTPEVRFRNFRYGRF